VSPSYESSFTPLTTQIQPRHLEIVHTDIPQLTASDQVLIKGKKKTSPRTSVSGIELIKWTSTRDLKSHLYWSLWHRSPCRRGWFVQFPWAERRRKKLWFGIFLFFFLGRVPSQVSCEFFLLFSSEILRIEDGGISQHFTSSLSLAMKS